jgi:hypothetical protein
MQQNPCSGAVKLLQNAADDLSKLLKFVDNIANWWPKIEREIPAVLERIVSTDNEIIGGIRTDDLRDGWEGIKNDYLRYKARVRDQFPQHRVI